jgi:hypothetical protein
MSGAVTPPNLQNCQVDKIVKSDSPHYSLTQNVYYFEFETVIQSLLLKLYLPRAQENVLVCKHVPSFFGFRS